MPIYEYYCSECDCHFEMIRPVSESKLGSPCPQCGVEAKRELSSFSHYCMTPYDAPERRRDEGQRKMWESSRKVEDMKKKDPDPLKKWREERQKTLGVGPERWVQWANEEKAKEQKKKDYGENWKGREA